MISQRKRGGGTIAFQNKTLWQGLSRTDLLLAPPGMTRDQARTLIHATHYDPNDQHGSSPAPKIHTMARMTGREGASYRGKPMPPLAVPEKPINPSGSQKQSAKRSSPKKQR